MPGRSIGFGVLMGWADIVGEAKSKESRSLIYI
jgi:hypothetical protein